MASQRRNRRSVLGSRARPGTAAATAARVGHDYSATLDAAGGTPPYRWAITAQPPNERLALDPDTGVLSFRPQAPTGSAGLDAVVRLTAALAASVSQPINIVVEP